MKYTLEDFYREAGFAEYPPWAKEIRLWDAQFNCDLKPRWNQVSALTLAFQFDNRRSGIFDEMGTGKTLPAQAFLIWYAWAGVKCLALMPRVLLEQFRVSLMETFVGIEKHLTWGIYHGEKKRRDKLFNQWDAEGAPDIVMSTYDMFRDECLVFAAFNLEAMVFDEAKFLGNPDSGIYGAVENFMGPEGEKAAVVMNGTPARNNLLDLYGVIRFITPQAYDSKDDFILQHVRFTKVGVATGRSSTGEVKKRNQEIIDRFVDTTTIFTRLYAQARRVEKHEVMDLPTKNIMLKHYALSPAHMKQYKKLVDDRLLMFPDGSMIDATASATLRNTCAQSIVSPELIQISGESMAFEMIDELLDEIDLNQTKVVIFAHFQLTIDKLLERYKKYSPASMYGKTSNPGKEKDRFLKDPKCRLMIANYLSGGVGLNLQSVCYSVICAEPTGVPGDFLQAIDRVHRGGQTHKVNVYVIVPTGTIFVKIVRDMTKKNTQNAGVVSKDKLQAELFGQEDSEDVDIPMEA